MSAIYDQTGVLPGTALPKRQSVAATVLTVCAVMLTVASGFVFGAAGAIMTVAAFAGACAALVAGSDPSRRGARLAVVAVLVVAVAAAATRI